MDSFFEKIGGYVVKIWRYFSLFEKGTYIDNNAILDGDALIYGKGIGYRKTIYILWAMMIMADVVLIIFGATS